MAKNKKTGAKNNTGASFTSTAPVNYNLEGAAFDPTTVPGFVDLMKDPSAVKGTDQMRLVAQVRKFGLLDADDNDIMSLPMDEMADFIDFIAAKFSKDPEAFDKFTSTEDGIQRACDLATTFVLLVGKRRNSAV